jgi:hypothetical protein
MSRQFFKIFSLALLAVIVVVGSVAGQKGGGGGTKDIPMKAVFSDGFKITGDSDLLYVHQGTGPGMNSLVIFQIGGWLKGAFEMVIHSNSGRYVNLLFDNAVDFPPTDPLPAGCGYPYFLYPPYSRTEPVETTQFRLGTIWKCQWIPHDGWTELIRSTTRKDATILDLTTMRMGETVGVSFEMAEFRVKDDPLTPGYDESVDGFGLSGYPHGAGYLLVTATDWDNNKIMDWTLKTISGRLVVKEYDRTADLPYGDCFKLNSGSLCYCGAFSMPFELKIARK